jgi:hypothetical protein
MPGGEKPAYAMRVIARLIATPSHSARETGAGSISHSAR